MGYLKEIIDIKGKIFGIRISFCPETKNIYFSIIIWDVDDWFVYNETIDFSSSYWIDDLIEVSKETKNWMEKFCEKEKYGWKLKENGANYESR